MKAYGKKIDMRLHIIRTTAPIWILGGILYLVPAISQHDMRPCGALFNRLYETYTGSSNSWVADLMGAKIVSERMTEYYPSWPAPLSCIATYWTTLLPKDAP